MKCWVAKRKMAAYLDGAVSPEERREIGRHLDGCGSCAEDSARLESVRMALRSLPRRMVPDSLTMRLRVLASHERARRFGSAMGCWEAIRFALSNMMRPIGLPAAGGLCSTLLLFSTLVPTFTIPRVANDVPALLFTQPILTSINPIGFISGGEVNVDLRLDETGRIVNYSIVEDGRHSESVRSSIANSLLFTRFSPALVAPNSCTDCAVPMPSTIRVVFRPSANIDVKG